MLTSRWALLLLVVVVAAIATAAHAESVLPKAQQAKQHFDRGVEFLGQSKWSEAIVELEAARTFYPTAPIHFNLGLAYRAAGRAREAIAAFGRYRRAIGDAPDPRQAEVSRYLTTLRASLAQLQFDLTPPEATVHVDNDPVPRSTGFVEVDPGTHKIVATADGYSPATRHLTVPPGSTSRIQLQLVRLKRRAYLSVVSSVPSGAIRIDGVGQGKGRVELELEPGKHLIEVKADRYETVRREVVLDAAAHQDVTMVLKRPRHVGTWVAVGVGVAAIAGAAIATGVLLGVKDQPPVVPPLGIVHTGLKVASW